MLHTTFVRVREDGVQRLRAWLRDLPRRREELHSSYASEGTRHEQFFLIRDGAGPLLVLISELEDPERGSTSFLLSHRPLDVEFKRLIQEISDGDAPAEVLYDSAALVPARRRPASG